MNVHTKRIADPITVDRAYFAKVVNRADQLSAILTMLHGTLEDVFDNRKVVNGGVCDLLASEDFFQSTVIVASMASDMARESVDDLATAEVSS